MKGAKVEGAKYKSVTPPLRSGLCKIIRVGNVYKTEKIIAMGNSRSLICCNDELFLFLKTMFYLPRRCDAENKKDGVFEI